MTLQDETLRLKFDNSYNGRLFAVQGDTGRIFNLQILSDMDNVLDITGMALRLYIGNDKEVSYTDGEITQAEEGKFKVQVFNSQLKYPGLQKAQFVLTDKDGQKVGSKVFDLYVEEGLETGQTLGKNIFVDFETIDETLKLIKNYDKTLEEAKEVDLKLKVDIQEGTETREALADCKKKALEIKGQLDTSKTDAGKTLEDLKVTKTESETLNADLSSENTKASDNIRILGEKTEAGNSTIAGLSQSTSAAKATKESLDTSTTTALSTKKTLEEVTSTANSTKENLETLKGQGDDLSRDLSSKITSGDSLKTNLDKSIGAASTSKGNLDVSIETAANTNSTLKNTDTEAKGTEQLLRDLLGQIGSTEQEVKRIIASGNLGKYVTDPKLQEALKAYVTQENIEENYLGKEYFFNNAQDIFDDLSRNNELHLDSGRINKLDDRMKIIKTSGGQTDLASLFFAIDFLLSKKIDTLSIVDNLNSGGKDKVLSAEQGKILKNSKIDKKYGYGLSKNDYTDEDKAQVASIPEYVKQYKLLDADIGYVNNGSTGVSGPLGDEGIRSLGNAFSIIDMFLAKLVINKNIHITLHDAIDVTLNRLGDMCEISIIATNQKISNIAGFITNEIVINHEEIGKFFAMDAPIPLTGIIKNAGQSEYQNGGKKYGEIFTPMIISSDSNSMKITTNIYWEDYITKYQLNNVDIIIHGMFFCK